ncbi:MAG: PhoX family protein [Beijerinckiaceae bacterium]
MLDHDIRIELEAGDEPMCNTSVNRTFADVADSFLSRRGLLAGAGAFALTAAFTASARADGAAASEARETSKLLGFEPVAPSVQDGVSVPKGYRTQVIAAWGEPVSGSAPAFSPAASARDQEKQLGMHHDGMHFFPTGGSSTDGLLVVNHEYVEPRFLHASYAGKPLKSDDVIVENGVRDPEHVLKEINAHGVSILRIARGADGRWEIREDSRARRITGQTPMEIAGPVRGDNLVKTKYSPDGTRVRGTLNNCAHGVTPWNTYMTAEENWASYFRNGAQADGKPALPREQARYGVRSGRSRYGWELAAGAADEFRRFDATPGGADASQDYRNEPNGFGWMVEIDPFNPSALPVKRTALGRFAHEGVVFAPAVEGRPVVCYSGDDALFEYIYKFVSAKPYNAATASGALLDEGVLYVARFNDDGSGEWLPLVHGEGPLTAANGFRSQADVLVNTRLAADRVGATKMDRPEWGAIEPKSGAVYFTLTNNSRRSDKDRNAANPRAANAFGHIIRWNEEGGDHAATRFRWSIFLLAGDEGDSRGADGKPLDAAGAHACPDGLWFDGAGRLWIQTDMGESAMYRGRLQAFGSNQMLAADPVTGEVRRFLVGPVGQEITGVVETPDARTMFINVQHPGANTSAEDFAAGKFASNWPDGAGRVPRSATVVITREDGGVIGA